MLHSPTNFRNIWIHLKFLNYSSQPALNLLTCKCKITTITTTYELIIIWKDDAFKIQNAMLCHCNAEDDLYLWVQTEAALTCRARCTGGNLPSSEHAASSHNRNQSPLREKRNSLHPWIHQRSTSHHYYFITYINATWILARICDLLRIILLPFFADSSIRNA